MTFLRRAAGACAIIGLLLGAVAGGRMMYPPQVQNLLQSPLLQLLVVAAALLTVASLFFWAGEPGQSERWAFVVAISTAGGLGVMANLVAPALGWWRGPVFEGPRLPLALLTGLKAIVYFGLFLTLYRRVRPRWLAPVLYLALLVALIPATLKGDRMVLGTGVLAFGAGYTLWHDVAFGEAMFALPPILYEMLLRWRGAA